MSFRVSPESFSLILYILLIGGALTVLTAFITMGIAIVVALLITASIFFITFFFRDPVRNSPTGDKLVISPADGEIIDISPRKEDEYIRDDCIRISIFMSLWNVHINRIPVSGVVDYMKYHSGRFFAAFREHASFKNEMQSIGINTGDHRILIRQIAGILARRIRTYAEKGDRVIAGDKLGLIAFGSRVDVFLPQASMISVRLGQKTRGGESILGELP
ncbi:MAG: phosphatidylserine decarboxylase family protein [Candidatus Glassbacteria bacterium]